MERAMRVAIGDILRPLPDLRVTRKPRFMRGPQPILKALCFRARGIKNVEPEPRLLARERRGDVLGEVGPVAGDRGGRLLQPGRELERPRLRAPCRLVRPPSD